MSKTTCTMHDERYRNAPLVGRGVTLCTCRPITVTATLPTQPAMPPTCKQKDTMPADPQPTYGLAILKAGQCLEQAAAPTTPLDVAQKLVNVADGWTRLAAVINPR